MNRTYGRFWYDEKTKDWNVKAEPHIMIRIKRVFERISKGQFGQVTLGDSDEVRRDLDWFLARYNLEGSDKDWQRIADGAENHKEEILTLEKILDKNWKPRREIKMALPPRQYQLQAAEVILQRKFLLLGDDLGLGKTCSAITCFTEPRTQPALVVTLAGILPIQWMAEINRFIPELFVHVVKKRKPYELPKQDGRGPDVLVINYAKLDAWAEFLAKYIKMVVFDECLRGDSLISLWPATRSCLLRDIKPGDKIASFDQAGNVLPDFVVGKKHKGRREIWRITLEDGRFLDCTDNERLWTNYGWLYLRDIINASCCKDAAKQTNSFEGCGAPGLSWDTSWRRQFIMAEGLSVPQNDHETRVQTEGLLPAQGKNSKELCKNTSSHREKRRMGEGALCFCDGYFSRLRIFTLDVLPQNLERPPEKDGYEGVGVGIGVARTSLLVHGRRISEYEKWDGKLLNSFVYKERSPNAGGPFGGVGHTGVGGGCVEGCPSILDDPAAHRSVQTIYQEDSAVHPFVNVIQKETSEASSPEVMFGVSDKNPRRNKAEWSHVYLLQKQKMSHDRDAGEKRIPLRHAPALVGYQVISVEKVGIDDVWDIETERHNTLFANGMAVHNCQELRHQGTAKYDAAVHIARHARYKAGLSATPIFNYGGEIYNILDVLKQGALGKYEEFFREWCTTAYGEKKISVKDPKALGTYLRENFLMLRRTRKEVGRELPPLSKIPHKIAVDMEALDKVGDSAAALAKLIISGQMKTGFEKMKASEELSHLLRQATGLAKAPYVADFVRMLVEDGESVVVYAWHRGVYDILKTKLEDLKPMMITGAESTKEKIEAKKSFIKGTTKILFVSLRAGAGIDGLQNVCNTVVIAELDWSPGVMEQCIGRVFRDGQKEPVVAYYLVTEEGSDPTLSQALGLKTEQVEGIRNPDQELVETLQVDEDRIRTLAANYLAKNKTKTDDLELEEAESEA